MRGTREARLRGRAVAALGAQAPRRPALKVVTIARDTRYTVAAGKRKRLTLTLGAEARRVMARRRSLRVKIALKRSGRPAVTRTVMLRR